MIVARAIALEYLRTVLREKPQIYFRSFHTEISEIIKAVNFEDIYSLMFHIAGLHTGGGHITNIQDAIRQAIFDIRKDPAMRDAEILVINDGSTDDTRRVIEAIKDSRIRYFYKENGGVSAARNLGLQKAKGDYICFLDSDDLWPENFLEIMLQKLQQNSFIKKIIFQMTYIKTAGSY